MYLFDLTLSILGDILNVLSNYLMFAGHIKVLGGPDVAHAWYATIFHYLPNHDDFLHLSLFIVYIPCPPPLEVCDVNNVRPFGT